MWTMSYLTNLLSYVYPSPSSHSHQTMSLTPPLLPHCTCPPPPSLATLYLSSTSPPCQTVPVLHLPSSPLPVIESIGDLMAPFEPARGFFDEPTISISASHWSFDDSPISPLIGLWTIHFSHLSLVHERFEK